MVYAYEKDMDGLVPGTHVWAAGFGVSRCGTKVIMDLRPCLCELCCWHDKHAEQLLRDKGRPVRIVVPVRDDGSLDWKDRRTIGTGIDISDTEEEAVIAYVRMAEASMKTVRKAQASVADTAGKALAAANYLNKE